MSLLLIKILKSWEMCEIRGGLNLSYKCMTSFETNERLINLRTENPKLWEDLNTKSTRTYCPGEDEEVQEDLEVHDDEEMGADGAEIPTQEVIRHIVAKKTGKNRKVKSAKDSGRVGLVSSAQAEDIDVEVAAVEGTAGDGEIELEQSGKRMRRANVRYADFWRHANDKGEDLELPGLK